MNFHIITLFPESIQCYLDSSILGKAQARKALSITYYNPRDYSDDKWHSVDGKPYGGGPGMVLQALPFIRAVDAARGRKKKVKTIFFSPSGRQFTEEYAKELKENYSHLILIAGRYEGVDDRLREAVDAEEVSIGPYTLTGGELPAAVVIDSVSRNVSGVLGNELSREDARVASPRVYTRPEIFTYRRKKFSVPSVLLSGNHKEIEEWRKETKSNMKREL